MPIVTKCANEGCGQPVRVKDEFAGKKVRCPKCQGVIAIPGAAAKAPAPQPAARTSPAKPAAVALKGKPADDFDYEDEPVAKKSIKPARADDFEEDRPEARSTTAKD